MNHWSLFLLPMFYFVALSRPTWADQLSREQMIEYVAQSICIDDAGAPTDAMPISTDCHRTRLQRSDDMVTYRKHDWPNAHDGPQIALGYQASDSVLQHRASHLLVVQTFDFGTDGRTFGRFDGGRGDGGQVLVFVGDWASFAMTEDGGGGVQWFIGEGCRSRRSHESKFISWRVFSNNIATESWGSAVARLNITSSLESCPRIFNDAYTRYRRDTVVFPFRLPLAISADKISHQQLDVIVSEHYGGSDIRSADHLERFFFAKKLGLVRWERWANGNLRQSPGMHEAATALARTARCPTLQHYGVPDPRWWLVDCRTWTTLIRPTTPWSVDMYRWPALEAFGPLQ